MKCNVKYCVTFATEISLKVISSCSNNIKALVMDYMPKGSLEKWLYYHNCFLDVMQRLDIVIDVASALGYLHCSFSKPVIHCDLKPSNVLLDEGMVVYVSNFGMAKLLADEDSIMHTRTMATLGSMAPGESLYLFQDFYIMVHRSSLYSLGDE